MIGVNVNRKKYDKNWVHTYSVYLFYSFHPLPGCCGVPLKTNSCLSDTPITSTTRLFFSLTLFRVSSFESLNSTHCWHDMITTGIQRVGEGTFEDGTDQRCMLLTILYNVLKQPLYKVLKIVFVHEGTQNLNRAGSVHQCNIMCIFWHICSVLYLYQHPLMILPFRYTSTKFSSKTGMWFQTCFTASSYQIFVNPDFPIGLMPLPPQSFFPTTTKVRKRPVTSFEKYVGRLEAKKYDSVCMFDMPKGKISLYTIAVDRKTK